jgi:hypothetical protein
MVIQKIFIKPPLVLFDPAIFFFTAMGVYKLVYSGLYLILWRKTRKALGDFIGALFYFFISFILTNYAADVFTNRITLAYLIIAFGLRIIINAIMYFTSTEKR